MSSLYPEIPVNRSGHLQVSGGHRVYWEESGNPDGIPALFVHGGPGGGTSPAHRRYFDPAAYRIVLFDQRGCGQSRPHASLEHNTTWDLVGDMERIRELLGIDRWLLFGGSWGSTLALAYAQAHPGRVRAMVLRGIFMLRPREIRWFYQYGASELFPEAWEDFLAPIPEAERDDLVHAYHRRLTSDDPQVRARVAVAWSVWEARTSKLIPDTGLVTHHGGTGFAEAFARIECHYFVNGGFLSGPEQLLDGAVRLRDVPAVIVQGRYDVVCPVRTAWELHRRWPEAELRIVPDAGHSATEPAIAEQLVAATDRFRGD
ncbi:MAG TPA: prolyl aminopeptidase [Gammaproteobacteria bacterium]|nr:prolyl aminopeptidase [Gammaproteobacteria bacterium]